MSTEFTRQELAEFDRITADASDRNQVARISGRLELSKFIAKHGKEKCDAMYQAIIDAENAKKRRRK